MKASSSLVAAAFGGILLGATGCGGGAGAAGEPQMQSDAPQATGEATGEKHACKGKNECRGLGGCKSDSHACKGMNDCKGQGGCKG